MGPAASAVTTADLDQTLQSSPVKEILVLWLLLPPDVWHSPADGRAIFQCCASYYEVTRSFRLHEYMSLLEVIMAQ